MLGMTRSVVGVAGLVAGVLFAGCAAGGSEQPPPPPPEETNALADFDPCEALSAEEIQSIGASPEGEPNDLGVGEVGCDYEGDEFDFGVLKAESHDQAYWEGQRDGFDEFTPNQVGTRDGFAAVAPGGAGQGVCRQIMYSGGGSVIVDITYQSDAMDGADPCGKAMEIAEQVEPKLPE